MAQLLHTQRVSATNTRTARTTEALEAHRQISIVGSEADGTPEIAYCDAGMVPAGSVQESWASGVLATIFTPEGTHRLTAAGLIAEGDKTKPANDGKLQTDGTSGSTATSSDTCGAAESAAAADGDLFEHHYK